MIYDNYANQSQTDFLDSNQFSGGLYSATKSKNESNIPLAGSPVPIGTSRIFISNYFLILALLFYIVKRQKLSFLQVQRINFFIFRWTPGDMIR
jgi:hypothetical protein